MNELQQTISISDVSDIPKDLFESLGSCEGYWQQLLSAPDQDVVVDVILQLKRKIDYVSKGMSRLYESNLKCMTYALHLKQGKARSEEYYISELEVHC